MNSPEYPVSPSAQQPFSSSSWARQPQTSILRKASSSVTGQASQLFRHFCQKHTKAVAAAAIAVKMLRVMEKTSISSSISVSPWKTRKTWLNGTHTCRRKVFGSWDAWPGTAEGRASISRIRMAMWVRLDPGGSGRIMIWRGGGYSMSFLQINIIIICGESMAWRPMDGHRSWNSTTGYITYLNRLIHPIYAHVAIDAVHDQWLSRLLSWTWLLELTRSLGWYWWDW